MVFLSSLTSFEWRLFSTVLLATLHNTPPHNTSLNCTALYYSFSSHTAHLGFTLTPLTVYLSYTPFRSILFHSAAHSKTQSVLLVNGVDEMLKKGKNTCAALKAAIDGALTILITDATKAKSNMTSSCDKVSEWPSV